MRVEEAKRQLLELDDSGFNVDSVYAECGFRSRSTFFLAFKKMEGSTPAAWLSRMREEA
jgi:AraC-like DNA-binding protein